MKKLIAIVLAAVTPVALFAGCGERGGGQTATYEQVMAKFEGEPEKNVTLKVLDNDIAREQGYFDQLIGAFNEKYAKYGIKAEDANMSQYTDLEKNGPLGYGPDVLYDANDKIMRYAENNHVLALPTEKLEAYGEGKTDSAVTEPYSMNKYGMDLQFGVPINVQTPVMYYLKDTFAKEADADGDGTPDVLETYNALYAYSKGVRANSTVDNPVFGYAPVLFAAFAVFVSLMLWGFVCAKMRTNFKDSAYVGFSAAEAVEESRDSALRPVLGVVVATALAFALLGGLATAGMRYFFLPALIPVAVGTYSSLVLVPAIYAQFKKISDRIAAKRKRYDYGKGKKSDKTETA